MKIVRLFSFSILACVVGASSAAPSQDNSRDRNLEVDVDKVLNGCTEHGRCGDEFAVGMESARASALVVRAWRVRDATLFLGKEQSALLSDIQGRMAMTNSIDYLRVAIEVEAVKGNEATVLSRQQFSRVLQVAVGRERRRVTTVTHRETWEKSERGWRLRGFTEENPTARWDDESPLPR